MFKSAPGIQKKVGRIYIFYLGIFRNALPNLSNTSCKGCIMKGLDGKLRDCHHMLFSMAMDYPEACLFALVIYGNACPVCRATQENFDKL